MDDTVISLEKHTPEGGIGRGGGLLQAGDLVPRGWNLPGLRGRRRWRRDKERGLENGGEGRGGRGLLPGASTPPFMAPATVCVGATAD